MSFEDVVEVGGRVVQAFADLTARGLRKALFKLREPIVGGDVKRRFNELVNLPLVELCSADNMIDPEFDPNYFTPNKAFRPGCGKFEAEALGRALILASIKNGRWHAVPWPVLALAHHGGGPQNLWDWISSSLSWSRTAQNVDNLATVSRVKDDGDAPEVLIFDGLNFKRQNYEFNGLHDYMPIGIDVLIESKLVTVTRDRNGVDLIAPTTELLRRAKSSAELNNR